MMTTNVRHWCQALPLSLSILCAAAAALAAESEANTKESEAAFRRGLACGDAPCACVNFEHGLLLNPARPSLWVRVALCRLQENDNAGAWRALIKARELNRASDNFRADLEPVIKKQLESIPTLTIELDPAPADLELFLDGGRLQEPPGEPVGVRRGKHELRAEAPGYETYNASIEVDELRERVQLELVATPKPAPSPPVTLPLAAAAGSAQVGSDTGPHGVVPDDDGSTQRIAGYTLGAAGVVGLGIGAIFGIKALGLVSDSDPYCDARNACDEEGVRLRERADNAQTIGIVAGVVGGLALGGGLVLLLTAPDGTLGESAQAPSRLDLAFTGTTVQARAHW